VKLVQMPTELLHLEEADLPSAGVDSSLLAAFRAYLPTAPDDRRGVAILATSGAGTRELLMVLARRIGAALRDENIHLRDRGGELKAGRKKLCYLPGRVLAAAFGAVGARRALADEAVCFFQDLDEVWSTEDGAVSLAPNALLALMDERLAGGRPTFLTADAKWLPNGLEGGLRARLRIFEAA
jgi:hypothetical protein